MDSSHSLNLINFARRWDLDGSGDSHPGRKSINHRSAMSPSLLLQTKKMLISPLGSGQRHFFSGDLPRSISPLSLFLSVPTSLVLIRYNQTSTHVGGETKNGEGWH